MFMLTFEEIKNLDHTKGNFVHCFVCKKECVEKGYDLFYEIKLICSRDVNEYVYFKEDKKKIARKHLIFHAKCWKEFAGEELCFEK